jgi:7-cyano-7-deazaguanine synthase in queuosine biosynthesis
MKKYQRLVMLSGGVDSTASLYIYLKQNPTHWVYVHHCNMLSPGNRVKEETRSARDVVEWIKQNVSENITYTETDFSYRDLAHIVQDIEVMGFLTGLILRSRTYHIEKVTINASLHDFALPGYQIRAKRRFKIIEAMTNRLIEYDYIIKDMTREQVIKSIPSELLRLTHFCRRPVNGENCQECVTCKATIKHL